MVKYQVSFEGNQHPAAFDLPDGGLIDAFVDWLKDKANPDHFVFAGPPGKTSVIAFTHVSTVTAVEDPKERKPPFQD